MYLYSVTFVYALSAQLDQQDDNNDELWQYCIVEHWSLICWSRAYIVEEARELDSLQG